MSLKYFADLFLAHAVSPESRKSIHQILLADKARVVNIKALEKPLEDLIGQSH